MSQQDQRDMFGALQYEQGPPPPYAGSSTPFSIPYTYHPWPQVQEQSYPDFPETSLYQNAQFPQEKPTEALPHKHEYWGADGHVRASSQQRPLEESHSSPSCYTSSIAASSNEDVLSQALAFTKHTAPPSFHTSRLVSPIAIPQTTAGRGQSFLRSWAPTVEEQNISQADFLAFIDNLNVVSTANPPLQVLNLADGVLGMVPHHWFMLAGLAIQATAQLGTAAVSKGRTEMYMKEVNEKMFEPRGIKVSIASIEAIQVVLSIPTSQPLLAPLNDQTMELSTSRRVLSSLIPYNSRLELNVPPPSQQATVIARLSAKQVESKAKKNQKKTIQDRHKEIEKENSRERKAEKKARSRERKKAKKARSRERKERKRVRKHGKKTKEDDNLSDDD